MRRLNVRLGCLAFVAAPVLLLCSGAASAIFPNAAPIAIPDCCAPQPAGAYPATVSVSGLTGTVTKVTATLTGLTHSASSDLDVLLVAPTGVHKVLLMSDSGVSASGVDLTFDDAAATSLPDATPLTSGTFKPTNRGEDCPGTGDSFPSPAPAGPYGGALSDFDTLDPNGIWSLYVVDDCQVDSGQVAGGFSLTFTTTSTPPSAATTFASSSALTIGDCCPATPAGAYPSNIVISGQPGPITGISVTLKGLTHATVADVNALLVSPTGLKVLLTSDSGGTASNAAVTFAEAGSPLPATGPVTTGTYAPTDRAATCAGPTTPPFPAPAPSGPYGSSLSSFNGTEPNGTWSLYVMDACSGDTGSIGQGWSLAVSNAQTAVTIAAFTGTRGPRGVTLRWRTAQETSLLGFDLYRGAKRITKRLIPAKAAVRTTGAAYSFLDRTARPGVAYTYGLQAVGMNGKRSFRASVKVRAGKGRHVAASRARRNVAADPVSLNFACALQKNGSLRYVDDTAQCRKNENAVTISPGPVYVCVQADGSSRRVADAGACPSPGKTVVLPPTSGSEYFCAGNDGRLRHVAAATDCSASESAVVAAAAGPQLMIKDVAQVDGIRVTEPVRIRATITPPSGQTISSWSVTYQGAQEPAPTTLAHGTGAAPSRLATFDPTLLPNDTYAITISATASGGETQSVTTTVAVAGDLKLGRYVTIYQDLSVPVNGFDMEVRRTYDSYDKEVGDFGFGWRVSLENFRVSENRPLGEGGWTVQPVGLFGCTFQTSLPHYVTVTFPDGHLEMFDFTPTNCNYFPPPTGEAAFTPRPATDTTSTLEVEGDTSLTYDFNGNLTGPGANPTRFKLTLHNGTELVLDKATGLVSETDRNGNFVTVDANGLHASNGESIAYARDGQGRIAQITGPSGQTVTYGYSGVGDLASSTDANGTTTYSYDADHNLLKAIGPGGQALQSLTYDSNGRLASITDANGRTTTIATDITGKQQTVTDPSGKLTIVYTYDDLGDLLERAMVGDGKTLITKFVYDSEGRLLTRIDPLARRWTAAYDSAGNLTRFTDPDGRTQTFEYDAFGNVTRMLEGADTTAALTLVYDTNGDLQTLTRADGSVFTYQHDTAGHLLSIKDPLNRARTFKYDAAGHRTREVDAAGNKTVIAVDASGRTTSITDATNVTTTFEYDLAGNLAVVDANGHKHTFAYDPLGNVVKATDPLGKSSLFEYGKAGRLTQSTDRDGRVTTYSYDADGRIVAVTPSDGDSASYRYDAFGRVIDLRDSDAVVHYTYDAAGRLISQFSSGTVSSAQPRVQLAYTYDGAGNRLTLTGPEGTTKYTYDSRARLIGVSDPLGQSFTFAYDALSRLERLVRPNGVDDLFAYDAADELRSRIGKRGATTVTSAMYAYDAAGFRSSMQDLAEVSMYTHDGAGRLTSATHPAGVMANETYQYDSLGNRSASAGSPLGTFIYDAADRLQSDAGHRYEYDNEGELVASIDKTSGARTAYAWNARHELVRIGHPDGSVTAYRYDPLGRRIEINDNGRVTRYAYDGENIHLEFDGSNSRTSYYTHDRGLDGALEMVRGGSPYYYLQDGLGSTMALTDAAGQPVAGYSYDAFGRPSGSEAIVNPFTFTGREFDPKSGLYFYRSRYYDPATGRFLSEDPVPAVNPYPYVENDPVDLVDPIGALAIEYEILMIRTQQARTIYQTVHRLNACLGLELLQAADALSGEPVAPRDESAVVWQALGSLPGFGNVQTAGKFADQVDRGQVADAAKTAINPALGAAGVFATGRAATALNVVKRLRQGRALYEKLAKRHEGDAGARCGSESDLLSATQTP